MSVATAYLLRRNLSNIEAILFAWGGMLIKQSFRYAALSALRQLQSYTICIGFVTESFFTGKCGRK